MRAALVAVAALTVWVPSFASAAPAEGAPGGAAQAAGAAARWLAENQRTNGSFFADDARPDDVAETVTSIAAAGGNAAVVERALGFIAGAGTRSLDSATYPAGSYGRVVTALVASGQDPRSFAGRDYVAPIESRFNQATGSYETQLYADALAVIGIAAAGGPVPTAALRYLEANRCPDGGWSHEPGCLQTDVDTTALVVCALAASGVAPTDPILRQARAFLVSAANSEDGFGLTKGDETNANSTGLALSALAALGEDPARSPWVSRRSGPVPALLELATTSGGFKYRSSRDTADGHATRQAIVGLLGMSYPVRHVAAGPGRPQGTPGTVTPTGRHRQAPLSTAPSPVAGSPGAPPLRAPDVELAGEGPRSSLTQTAPAPGAAIPIAAGLLIAVVAGLTTRLGRGGSP